MKIPHYQFICFLNKVYYAKLRATEPKPAMVFQMQALFCLISFSTFTACVGFHDNCDLDATETYAAEAHDVSLLQTNLAVQPKLSKVEDNPESVAPPTQIHRRSSSSKASKKLPDWMPKTTAELIHHSKEGLKAMMFFGIGEVANNVPSGTEPPDLRAGMFDVLGLLAVSLVLFAAAQFALPWVGEESREAAAQWIEISLCFVILTLAFCSYGVVQEYVMTMDYNGERFPSSPFLIFSNRIFVVGLASVVLSSRGKGPWTEASKYASIPALSVFLASFCQYESLLYITFPTQVVFKSCKIVPTMIMSTLMNATSHGYGDYIYAAIITSCVAGFTVASEDRESDNLGSSYIGIMMMMTFLVADALTSNGEKKIYNLWPEFDNVQMMFAVGFWTLIFSAVTVLTTVSFGAMVTFFGNNPAAIGHVIGLSVCSAGGQYLIFYIIKHHGPVIFSIMMTVRQMFSIVISTVLFGHNMGMTQIGCASMCFAAMLGKPLLKHLYADKKVSTDRVYAASTSKAATDHLPGENKGR